MFKFKFIALAIVCIYLVFALPDGIHASTDDPVLLTIELTATENEEKSVVELTYSDLTALPVAAFTTMTNWTSGPQDFTGVPLNALLDSLEVTTGQIEMVAINEYSIMLEVEDSTNAGAMIAYILNGETMTPRDKGPLWLVYNYESAPMFRTETIYSRSIWQLDRIIISR